MQNQYVWLIFLVPLLSFGIIALILRPFFKTRLKLAGYVTIGAVSVSTILSFVTLFAVFGKPGHQLVVSDFNWIILNGVANIQLGLIVDPLTIAMLIAVTIVALMVVIYSQGYMHGDAGYQRYFAIMSLFTTAMLGLVLANSLLLMFMFWELVGLCSYLLIGFWFHRPSAANAAKKAFLVTRLGDLGFLFAILYLFAHVGTFNLSELYQLAIAGTLTGSVLMWATLGILAGAIGKSAQFPLHVWLPDAMEGPTPVSALIHAATMAAAGVFLVARTYPLFEHSAVSLEAVAVVGGVTAIFAASIGLVQNDIKRVLAYSTISQFGYMMLGLATGGVAVGIFHLFNHAFFKALLFLGSGSANHATKTFDMREMGGLRKAMPWTFATFFIASLSLAGIWPLAGFWSKDEILGSAVSSQPVLFALGMITVFMTAFYMFRVIFLTFTGKYRGKEHLHESAANMVVPMVVLGILAIGSGWVNVTGGFSAFFGHGETKGIIEGLFGIFASPWPWVSLALGGGGIWLAYEMYYTKRISATAMGRRFAPLYRLFYNKYWMDELYQNIIVKKVLLGGAFAAARFFDSKIIDGGFNTLFIQRYVVRDFFKYLFAFDRKVVDGLVNFFGKMTLVAGRVTRKMQTGHLQLYGLVVVIGMAALILVFFIFG